MRDLLSAVAQRAATLLHIVIEREYLTLDTARRPERLKCLRDPLTLQTARHSQASKPAMHSGEESEDYEDSPPRRMRSRGSADQTFGLECLNTYISIIYTVTIYIYRKELNKTCQHYRRVVCKEGLQCTGAVPRGAHEEDLKGVGPRS